MATTLLIVITLSALLSIAPGVAAAIVQEDGAIEWLHVGLFAAAALAALAAARRPPAALDLPVALLFGALVELELDLDRRLFGRAVIDTRFLRDGAVPLLARLLVVLFLVGLATGVLTYAWRRRAELASAARALARAPSGRLLLGGLALLVTVEIFEKPLGRLMPFPRNFLEESLELLAAVYCCLGMIARASHDKR